MEAHFEIYFAHQIPWISGEINQLHGRIDISFRVKGTKGRGLMRFKSVREGRMGYVSSSTPTTQARCSTNSMLQFETLKWSLEPEGGQEISLLETESRDPFQQETADKVAVVA